MTIRTFTILPLVLLASSILLSVVSDHWWILKSMAIACLLLSAGISSISIGNQAASEPLITDLLLVGEDEVAIRLDAHSFVLKRYAPALAFFYFSFMLFSLVEVNFMDGGLDSSLWFHFLPTAASLLTPFLIWKCVDKGLGYGYPISLAMYDHAERFLKRIGRMMRAYRPFSYPLLALALICPVLLIGRHSLNTEVLLWTVALTCWATLLVLALSLAGHLSEEERKKQAAYLNWRLQKMFQRQREQRTI